MHDSLPGDHAALVTWTKATRTGPTIYKRLDGSELEINAGNTVINQSTPIGFYILSGYKEGGTTWKSYDDAENGIIAKTNAQHSSITCICRYEGKYIMDLILRNNAVSIEHPDGVFHAHSEYHNIKKEAIGLIEAGGMFILPARLKRQLGEISELLQSSNVDLDNLAEDMIVHRDMIERLINQNGLGLTLEVANNVIKLEP